MKARLAVLIAAAASVSLLAFALGRSASPAPPPPAPQIPTPAPKLHEVIIRLQDADPVIESARADKWDAPMGVSCANCHATRQPDSPISRPEDLKHFHQGLEFNHGGMSCAACHDPADNEQLRKADGTVVPWLEVMDLCAQCHGPQARDYRNGSHGGMTGHWDLEAGGRLRNNCTSCHDPHHPAFAPMMPAPPPRDRAVSIFDQQGAPAGEH